MPPVLRSFFVPRLPKKEVRRLSVGDIGEAAAAVVVAPGAVAGVSVAAVVVSAVGEVTGLSSCGAVDGRVDSSFAGTAEEASVEAGVAASFLPKRPPKIEFLLFGFGAASRVVEAGVVSATVDSAPATGATPEAPKSVVASPAGTIGSPTTRDAIRS